jgi:ribosome-binding protein aMBF1 (putative translation factor)
MANNTSPIGTSVADHIDRKRTRSERYRDAHEHLRPFEQIARVVIMRRARLGLSQQDLAERMGTTASVISRIEAASTAPAPKPSGGWPRPSRATPSSASTSAPPTNPRQSS